ncbi:MAG: heme o synthase [Anaerolineae bacterium]|nr:heme o synthase [Anaerolineae bacterium]
MDALNEMVQPVAVPRSLWKTAVTLFKLRVVSLLLLAAFGGAALGALVVESVSLWTWLLLAVTGTLSAGGASAINQYLERERDTHMRRTARRPLASGQIANPGLVLGIGVGMVLLAGMLALAAGKPALAFWVLLGAAIYVGVYTVWLKPRTTLNIVIGGAAGSCAVLSGGAAVGAWNVWGVWLLAALVFVWTPVHFWALAIAYRDDYAAAGFPMLPARVPPVTAARWTALHTVLTAVCALALGFWPQVDVWYLLPVGVVTAVLIQRTLILLQNPGQRRAALALFHLSNLYLALVLVVIMLATLWR